MYQRRRVVASVFLLAVGLFVRPVASLGQTSAVTGVSNVSGIERYYTQSATVGWEFILSTEIQVTHLGFWNVPGFDQSHDVGIWDTNPGHDLKAAATVSPTDQLTDGFRFKAIAPVTLMPGTYRIGCLLIGGIDPDAFALQDASGTFDSRIEWKRAVSSFVGSGFTYPLVNETGVGLAFLNANFRFQDPTAVPEPALVQLPFLLGLAGLGYMRRRCRH